MPYDLVTPFGVRPGQVSPEEEMNQRTQMTNMQLMAQAQIAALQGQTERDVQGTYGQRSQQDMRMQQMHDQAQLGLVGAEGDQQVRAITASQAPGMGELAFNREKYQNTQALRDAEMKSQIEALTQKSQINSYLNSLLGFGGAAPSGPSQTGPAQAPNGGIGFGPPSAKDSAMGSSPAMSPGNQAAVGMLRGAGSGGAMNLSDPNTIRAIRVAIAARDGGAFPNFQAEDFQNQENALTLQGLNRDAARGKRADVIQQEQDAAGMGDYARVDQLRQQSGVSAPGAVNAAGEPQDLELQMDMKMVEQNMHRVMSAYSNDIPASTAIQPLMALLAKAKGRMPVSQAEAWIRDKVNRATQFSPNVSGSGRGDNTNMIRQAVGLPPILPDSGANTSTVGDAVQQGAGVAMKLPGLL